MSDISKIDMERIEGLLSKFEEMTNKLNSMKYIVETWQEGTEWYRIWSDGWIEQGGYYSKSGTYQFKKPFQNTNYCLVNGSTQTSGDMVTYNRDALYSRTSTSFTVLVGSYGTWYACGY